MTVFINIEPEYGYSRHRAHLESCLILSEVYHSIHKLIISKLKEIIFAERKMTLFRLKYEGFPGFPSAKRKLKWHCDLNLL